MPSEQSASTQPQPEDLDLSREQIKVCIFCRAPVSSSDADYPAHQLLIEPDIPLLCTGCRETRNIPARQQHPIPAGGRGSFSGSELVRPILQVPPDGPSPIPFPTSQTHPRHPHWTVRNYRVRFPCPPNPTPICPGYRTRSTTLQKSKIKQIIYTQSPGLHLPSPPVSEGVQASNYVLPQPAGGYHKASRPVTHPSLSLPRSYVHRYTEKRAEQLRCQRDHCGTSPPIIASVI
jgi:hypothetical protein